MRAALLGALLAAGCNTLLGNENFAGPGGGNPDACTGIGCLVVDCASRGQPPTRISGTVFGPDGTLPIYNALVYVPTKPLEPIVDGPASPACASGEPAVHARSDVGGAFVLENVPSVPNLPVVIQVGKWRRELVVPAVAECAETKLAAATTRLPRNASEGHIPRIAIVTGAAENLECLTRSLGLDDTEHATGTGTGRIHLYRGESGTITTLPGGVPIDPVANLYANFGRYELVMFGCEGQALMRPPTVQQGLRTYVDGGGQLWLTHFHSTWLTTVGAPFPAFAQFDIMRPQPQLPMTARIDTATPLGQAFAVWMMSVGGSTTLGQIVLPDGRNTCAGVDPAMADRRIYVDAGTGTLAGVQLLTWSPPNPGGGRVTFSDVHLLQGNPTPTMFPAECTPQPVRSQLAAIAFQVFDQATCLP